MTARVTTIVDADVDGQRVDVRIDGDSITAAGASLDRAGSEIVDAGGGALVPGLHDHHIHLLALAAARSSVDLRAEGDLDSVIRAAHGRAPAGAWIRAIGYDDVHGDLDRHRLDRLAPGRPVRVQHRSGAMWVMSSAALDLLGLRHGEDPGVEGDAAGEPTGRLHRLDDLVRERLPPPEALDLSAVGSLLAGNGVTGVTDATPYERADSIDVIAAARRTGTLPQRVVVTGGPALASTAPPKGLEVGPVKVIVADNALPTIEELVAAYTAARRARRPVAVHCVTTVGLVLALAAWEGVGAVEGDRIEHGSVIPIDLVARIHEFGLTVVTQPGFIADRGDRYRADVDPNEQPDLYRCGSLIDAGVPVAGSTDAPFGPADPWLAMRAAIERRTASGAPLGAAEAISPRRALELFLGPPDRPGGVARTIAPGAPADLCLLSAPLEVALRDPSAELVRGCWVGGQLAAGG